MKLPVVSIVGKPNTGKSTLFNIIADKKISITSEIKGVTRDRVFIRSMWNGKPFGLFDTAGIEETTSADFSEEMKEQTNMAIDYSDIIVFLVSAKDGLSEADKSIGTLLRRSKKKVLLVCNKIDNFNDITPSYDFYELGLGEPILISSINKLGIGDLLDEITKDFSVKDNSTDDETLKIAIIGKPNAGKSSLVNCIVGEKRVIVSDIPGTTRDSINTEIKRDGRTIVLTDTAGIRRKAKVNDKLEKYSIMRATLSIQSSDIAVLLVDATEGPSENDKKILGIAEEMGKGIIIALSKYDLIERTKENTDKIKDNIRNEFSFVRFAKIIFISSKDNKNIESLLKLCFNVFENYHRRIPSSPLNTLIQKSILMRDTPTHKGKKLKIFFCSQVGNAPPLFAFQVNDKMLMHFSYARFLENQIRETYDFEGVPIRFVFRGKND